jgi:F-type H+-transporting ATPase subunit a
VEETLKKRKGINRLLFLVICILGVLGAMAFPPIRPHIALQAEPVIKDLGTFLGQPFEITNTLIALFLGNLFLILMAFLIRRQIKSGEKALKGISGIVSLVIEAIYNLTKGTAGKWTSFIFPFFATITLLVLTQNLMELLPGVDSIGVFHEKYVHGDECVVQPLFHIGDLEVVNVGGADECSHSIFPFVRVASTDLNFTMGLAIVAVIMIQVAGLRAQGLAYLYKYFDPRPLIKSWRKPQFGGPLDMIGGLVYAIVGPLEIIAEFSKIISFTFRLFGAVFAGMVMLFVIGKLVPVFAQTIVLFLELLIGAVQALVFGMLTMVFMSMATKGHGDHGEEGAH